MNAPTVPTAVVPGWELDTAPFHAGELAVQQRAGVTEAAGSAGRRGIRRFMPDQHRTFSRNCRSSCSVALMRTASRGRRCGPARRGS